MTYCTNRLAECDLLGQCLNQLAAKYTNTKFVKIVSTDCIKNYPDNLLPTLLVYNSTNVKANLVGLRRFGGPKCTPEGEFSDQALFFFSPGNELVNHCPLIMCTNSEGLRAHYEFSVNAHSSSVFFIIRQVGLRCDNSLYISHNACLTSIFFGLDDTDVALVLSQVGPVLGNSGETDSDAVRQRVQRDYIEKMVLRHATKGGNNSDEDDS